MVEKFGGLAELDFLYQKKEGEDMRTPRGFAFVTYKEQHEAETARRVLDGLKVKGRQLKVKWAVQVGRVTHDKYIYSYFIYIYIFSVLQQYFFSYSFDMYYFGFLKVLFYSNIYTI